MNQKVNNKVNKIRRKSVSVEEVRRLVGEWAVSNPRGDYYSVPAHLNPERLERSPL